MVSRGQKLDLQFRLKVVHGGVANEVTFADLLTRPTIVSVYMRNHTATCDRQTSSLAAHAADLDRAGFNLVAISRDTAASHLRYVQARKITYTLASDPKDQFARAADALVEKSMYGRKFIGPARSAFVLDRDGTVLAVAANVDRMDHGAQLKELIKNLSGPSLG